MEKAVGSSVTAVKCEGVNLRGLSGHHTQEWYMASQHWPEWCMAALIIFNQIPNEPLGFEKTRWATFDHQCQKSEHIYILTFLTVIE